MIEIVRYGLSFLAGAVLGGLFVSSLWLTVKEIGRWRRPGAVVAVGYVIRAGTSVGVFLLIARGWGWQAVVSAIVGFVVVRTLLIGVLKRRERAT